MGLSRGVDNMGVAESWESAREGDSGAILDLGLLFPDIGRDNFRIQELRDDEESLTTSSPETSFCPSPDRSSDHLRAAPFCDAVGESSFAFEERRRNVVRVWEPGADEELVASEGLRLSGVAMVELVGGRETIDGVPRLEEFSTSVMICSGFLLFESVREGGVDWSGLPNARPAAATPTVLEATSCKKEKELLVLKDRKRMKTNVVLKMLRLVQGDQWVKTNEGQDTN